MLLAAKKVCARFHTLGEEQSHERRAQAMLDMMTGIPQQIIHGTTMTSSDVVIFWMASIVIVVLVLVTTTALVITGYRSVLRQSKMNQAERHYEASPQPQGGEQPQAHAPEEEKKEEKILLLR
jgi:hypothetical protein